MRACPGCAYLVPDSWETCFKCGTALVTPAAATAPDPPAWGAPPTWRPPVVTSALRPTVPPSRGRTIAIGAVVAAVVLLLGASIVVATTSNRVRPSVGVHGGSSDPVPAPDTEPDSGGVPAPIDLGKTPITPLTPMTVPKQTLTAELNAPSRDGVVIDDARAKQLIRDLVPTRARALLAADKGTLRALETGTALASDLSNCGCPDTPTIQAAQGAVAINGIWALVPKQTTYPASFLGELTLPAPSGRQFLELVVVVRTEASQPWKIALDNVTEFSGAPGDQHPGNYDASQFDIVPNQLRVPAPQLVADVALQWTQLKEHGVPMPASPFEAGVGASRAVYRQDTINGANGLRGHFTYRVDPGDRVYEFGLAGGDALVCGIVYTDVVWTAGDNGAPMQDAGRRAWGNDLAPGVYGRLVEHRISQPCIVLPARPNAGAQVLEGDEAYVEIAGSAVPNA